MGTIKDLVDLVTQIANSAEGRKIASELLKIQQLTLALQSEQASLHEANIEVREERQQLRDTIRTLEAKIQEMSARTGSVPSDVPMCPNCSTASRPFYMSPVPPDFIDLLNATHECPRCKYNTRVKS
jgi:cob(I)alamin adenosyltransferase